MSSFLVDRLKVLIDLIEKSFSAFSQESEIRLLSIASGSAQAVVEALKRSHHRLEDVCAEFQPHIIEMVGFLDYRPRKQAIRLIDRLADLLIQGGFIPENIP